ncbi:TM2 domain protein [compost metagenome]
MRHSTHTSLGSTHKSKTCATLLAVLLGGTGAHRFYLYGAKHFWAWIYLCAFVIFVLALLLAKAPHSLAVSLLVLFPLSIFAGWIEALTMGLTPDEKWDAQHNEWSGRQSDSRWSVVILIVLTFACGFTTVVISMARMTDLVLTGGAYG